MNRANFKIYIFLLSMSFPCALFAHTLTEPDKLLERFRLEEKAEKLLQQQDTVSYLDALKQGMQMYPDVMYFADKFVQYYMAKSQSAKAIEYVDKLLSKNPKDLSYLNLKAVIYKNIGKRDDAIALLQKILEIDPHYALTYDNLGYIHLRMEKIDDAIACFKKAIELDPKCWTAYGHLAFVYGKQNKVDESMAIYQKGLEIFPQDYLMSNNLALIYMAKKRNEEAIALFQNALKIKPTFMGCYDNLSACYLNMKKFDEIIKVNDAALKIAPLYYRAISNKANAYCMMQKNDEAVNVLMGFLKLFPNHSLAYYDLASIQKLQGKKDDAVNNCKKSILLNQSMKNPAYLMLARLYRELNRYDESIEIYNNYIVKGAPCSVYMELGDVYVRAGKNDEAALIYEKATELEPNDAMPVVALCCVYANLHRYEEAIVCAKKVKQLDPKSSGIDDFIKKMEEHVNKVGNDHNLVK